MTITLHMFWKAPFEEGASWSRLPFPAFLPVIFLGYTDVFKKKVFGFTGITNIKARLFSNPKRSPPSIMQDYPDSHNTKHCRWRIWQFTFLQNHVSAHHLTVLRMGHREDLSDGTEKRGPYRARGREGRLGGDGLSEDRLRILRNWDHKVEQMKGRESRKGGWKELNTNSLITQFDSGQLWWKSKLGHLALGHYTWNMAWPLEYVLHQIISFLSKHVAIICISWGISAYF